MAVWVVRAGGWGEQEQTALANELVTMHWNEFSDLSGVKNKDDMYALYRNTSPEATNQQVVREWDKSGHSALTSRKAI